MFKFSNISVTTTVPLVLALDPAERGTWVEKGGEAKVNAEGSSTTDRDPDLDEAGLEDPLSIDDFDTLILSSQMSTRSSPSRPTRAHRDSEQSDPGGSNLSADVPNHCRDDDDDFSLDSFVTAATRYMGGGSDGNGSNSSRSGGGGNVVGDAPRTREEKALARKKAAATKKRQREEAVRFRRAPLNPTHWYVSMPSTPPTATLIDFPPTRDPACTTATDLLFPE